MRFRRQRTLADARDAIDRLVLPPAVFKTCPWQPRELVEIGLRQWLRCCGAALRDNHAIGMPSHAVDEAWHGLILCTQYYAEFCERAFGRMLHHFPEGGPPGRVSDPMPEQLRRTVIAWHLVADPGEDAVLWDLDTRVGVEHPWGIPTDRVRHIEAALGNRS